MEKKSHLYHKIATTTSHHIIAIAKLKHHNIT